MIAAILVVGAVSAVASIGALLCAGFHALNEVFSADQAEARRRGQ